VRGPAVPGDGGANVVGVVPDRGSGLVVLDRAGGTLEQPDAHAKIATAASTAATTGIREPRNRSTSFGVPSRGHRNGEWQGHRQQRPSLTRASRAPQRRLVQSSYMSTKALILRQRDLRGSDEQDWRSLENLLENGCVPRVPVQSSLLRSHRLADRHKPHCDGPLRRHRLHRRMMGTARSRHIPQRRPRTPERRPSRAVRPGPISIWGHASLPALPPRCVEHG